MAKKILFMLSFGVFCSGLTQTARLGIKALGKTNNVYSNLNLPSNNIGTLAAGLSLEYELKNKIVLSADALYDQRGYSFLARFGSSIDPNLGSPGITDNIKYKYNYFSMPLKVGYELGQDRFRLLLNAGVVPAYILSAETHITQNGVNRTISNTQNTEKIDFAMQGDFMGAYHISETSVLRAGFTLQHSLRSVQKGTFFEILHKSFGFGVSYLVEL